MTSRNNHDRDRRRGIRGTIATACLGAILGWGTGCDGEVEDESTPRICELASVDMRACFGDDVAASFLDDCDPQYAESIAGGSCDQISARLLDTKADAPIDEAVQQAVQEVLREALERALALALEQVLERLPGAGDSWDVYLMVADAKSEADAETAREEWAARLAGHGGFAPTVVEYDSGWAVAHAPCTISLNELFAGFVAGIIVNDPDVLTLLGGTSVRVEDGMEVQLPLTLLPVDHDDAAHPRCE